MSDRAVSYHGRVRCRRGAFVVCVWAGTFGAAGCGRGEDPRVTAVQPAVPATPETPAVPAVPVEEEVAPALDCRTDSDCVAIATTCVGERVATKADAPRVRAEMEREGARMHCARMPWAPPHE